MIAIRERNSLRLEVKEFISLAIPLASAQLAQSATGFADTIMMGRMGADVLAAGGLASIIFFCILTTLSGAVMGVSPLVAEAFGAGQRNRIQQVSRQGLWLALLASIPMMMITGHMDAWMGSQSETTITLANTYLDIILWSLFPVAGFASLRSTVSALSKGRPIMVIIVIGTLFNIVGNYVLGFGKLGFPEMGLGGLALATVLAWWGMFIALGLYVVFHPSMRAYQFFKGIHLIKPKVLWELIWLGVPIGLFSGLEMGFFLVVMFLVGTFGTDALAAHQIVFETLVVVFMVPLGISYATTVRVGQWLGRNDFNGVQRAASVSAFLATAFTVVASTAFLIFPEYIIGLYIDVQAPENAAVVALATPILIVAAIAQVLDGLQKAVYGGLQGLQDTRIPMILNVLGYWGVGLSIGYVLGYQMEMGAIGLWIGQSIAIAMVAVLFGLRYFWLIEAQKFTAWDPSAIRKMSFSSTRK